jgi:hypothetical protein
MSRQERMAGPRKITIHDISFESEAHNIYSPHFSSQPSSSSEEYLSEQYYDEEQSSEQSIDSYGSDESIERQTQ